MFSKSLLAIICLALMFSLCYPQNNKGTEGTEFWVCFEKNFKGNGISISSKKITDTRTEYIFSKDENQNYLKNSDLKLILFSQSDNNVIIENEAINFKKMIHLTAGSFETVSIDPRFEMTTDKMPLKLAIYIKSDNPVSVMGINSQLQTSDSYTAIPVEKLGTEYILAGFSSNQGLNSQFAIISTDDNNNIKFIPPRIFNNQSASMPLEITLQKGEVYQYSGSDITGVMIRSSKKIAVFSGHQCAYVPDNVLACNHLVEQIPPVSILGNSYITGPLKGRKSSLIRIISSEEDTEIKLNGEISATLNSGEFIEKSGINYPLNIQSSKPVMVVQYSEGFKSDSAGDPMMMVLRPESLYSARYQVSSPLTGNWKNYVNIVINGAGIKNLKLDGANLIMEYIQIPGTDIYLGTLELGAGYHTIETTVPFSISKYGFGSGAQGYDAYGNM